MRQKTSTMTSFIECSSVFRLSMRFGQAGNQTGSGCGRARHLEEGKFEQSSFCWCCSLSVVILLWLIRLLVGFVLSFALWWRQLTLYNRIKSITSFSNCCIGFVEGTNKENMNLSFFNSILWIDYMKKSSNEFTWGKRLPLNVIYIFET